MKLPAVDDELVARLSDLSGTLQSDVRFEPYLTIYPLPSGTHYAIAKTWLDKDAPRSGCVLTRTALVGMAGWLAGDVCLPDILNALSPPSRDDRSLVQHPLEIETSSLPSNHVPAPPVEIEAFVAKYFGEGIRPIVWLRDGDASDILVSICRVLWPQLRRRFAACTLSLQPRSLSNAPFDLLFAPTAVYSRYSKIARENLIESSRSGKQRRVSEEWMMELAQLISSSRPLPIPLDWPHLDNALGPEPTAIRWLYLLNDLRARTQESPNAALGAMDVVERLCPDPSSEVHLKGAVAESALLAGDQIADARQALSFLQLVCERLSHSPYAQIGEGVLVDLRRRVGKWGYEALEQTLASYEELMGRTSAEEPARRSFRAGLIDGIKWLGEQGSHGLIALHRFDAAAGEIVPLHSSIGRSYLGIPAKGDFRPSKDLQRWLQNRSSDVNWPDWAGMLSSMADSSAVDDQLFGECFPRLSGADVGNLLLGVQASQLSGDLAHAIEKYFVPTHSPMVRRWAFALQPQSPESIRIASSTFDLSLSGILELLDYETADETTRVAILVQFLARLPYYAHFPNWLREAFDQRPKIVVDLVHAASAKLNGASDVLSRILRELDVLPFEAMDMLLPAIRSWTASPIPADLPPLLVRTIFVGALRGLGDTIELKQIDQIPSLATCVLEADSSRYANLFGAEIARNRELYGRAWLVLAEAPDAFYRSRRVVTVAVIGQLLRQPNVSWTHEITSSWWRALDRAKNLCEPRFYVRHCVQALSFSFGSGYLPVSSIVRCAFPDVYKAVAEQSPYSDEANSLLSFDWDRAKGLRRNLVDSFYQSNWPPGDLALTAAESFGLRKLFRRVWRKWSGEEYVARMISDLRQRNEPLAYSAVNELVSYYEKPNFYEPWD
ncbi:hypothetical protein [Bradyrhizobium sp. BWA-3-5]|uniref:GAP1-N1 domain-containing protein n=1 Tax=Bradyrhizobium sp. BWA-3-5 TaxID=3080013 RepID=UPI00293ECC2E|nr:hypothetical protein [Bradyrhizobium sp. BWA-3-5]WOH68870.1 hypothetical protein RX331_14695 [Bradyrhizobium sp. BWA-3-5]